MPGFTPAANEGNASPLFAPDKTVLEIQLHWFSDASSVAFGGVVYVRNWYADTSVTVSLLMSKTRVAPLETSTIPRLELCAAVLTTELLKASAEDLGIDTSRIFAWTDSTMVLSWLNSSNSRLKVYVACRVKEITDFLPASKWKNVPTVFNPTDLASREVLPTELLAKHLWWDCPPWLTESPDHWPSQPNQQRESHIPELGRVMKNIVVAPSDIWELYCDLKKLVRVVAWVVRFLTGC